MSFCLQLRIFDIDTFDAQVLAGHREAIMSVDVSPDGKLIATASKDKTVRYAHLRVRVDVVHSFEGYSFVVCVMTA